MQGTIQVSGKALGKGKPLFADFSVSIPPRTDRGEGGITLRELITRIVCHEVQTFRDRQEGHQFVRVLSSQQIEQAVEGGKVDAGGRHLKQSVDEDEAVAVALQGFEDGLYLVILDGEEHRDLDRQIFLNPDSRITFVRLVFLAGA